MLLLDTLINTIVSCLDGVIEIGDGVFTTDAERYAIFIMFGYGVDEHINPEDLTFRDLSGLDFVRNLALQASVVEIWNGLSIQERRSIAKAIRAGLFANDPKAILYAQALDAAPDQVFLLMFPDWQDRQLLTRVLSNSGGDHLKCDFWIAHLRGVFAEYELSRIDIGFQARWNAMPRALRRKIAIYVLTGAK